MLRALAHQAQGEDEPARAEIDRALADGVPAGYVRLFLDEGEPMERLLRASGSELVARESPDVAGLSEREVEVLRLLATRLSGPEISRELYVSLNTLRTHTKHIFSKLDVNSARGGGPPRPRARPALNHHLESHRVVMTGHHIGP